MDVRRVNRPRETAFGLFDEKTLDNPIKGDHNAHNTALSAASSSYSQAYCFFPVNSA
jgi:hypothetical protein